MSEPALAPALFRSFTFCPAERRVFAKKEPLTPSQWAERFRIVPIGAHKGPWRNDISPHIVKIMDTWALPHIREVVICKSPQTGGSEAMFNAMAYAMDRNPSTMMLIMPSEAQAKKVNADRIIPMIIESPRLFSLISPNPDDLAKMRIKLQNSTLLYMAWANSATALAAFPIKYLFFDETDKYPPTVGKETDPITLGEKRATTFRYTHKIFKVSTPTSENGHIWTAWNRADVQYKYHVTCPECDKEHIMSIDNLKWPETPSSSFPLLSPLYRGSAGNPSEKKDSGQAGVTEENSANSELPVSPADIHRDNLSWYECPHCQAQWTDTVKQQAVRLGQWKREKGKGLARPRSVAFHLPAWISPDISLSEIAATYILSKSDRAKLIDFYNGYLAEPYIEKHSSRKEESILILRDERPRGFVPGHIAGITAAIDTQQRGFYYELRAWGYGLDLESWQIREGFVESFDGLIKIINHDVYKDADGSEHKVALGLIDSGGGSGDFGVSRTAEVYDFCRRFRNIIPIKGQQRMSTTYRVSQLDTYPGTNKPIPGGLKLYNINVTYFKDYLSSKLTIAPADPGAWHLHSETTDDYARQMTAEYKDDKGLWQCPPKRANHFWDCGVYNLAAAEIIGIKYIQDPIINKTKPKEEQKHEVRQKEKSRRW